MIRHAPGVQVYARSTIFKEDAMNKAQQLAKLLIASTKNGDSTNWVLAERRDRELKAQIAELKETMTEDEIAKAGNIYSGWFGVYLRS
jgi:hypothetical protein